MHNIIQYIPQLEMNILYAQLTQKTIDKTSMTRQLLQISIMCALEVNVEGKITRRRWRSIAIR